MVRATLRATHDPVELSQDELGHLDLDVTDIPRDLVIDAHAQLSAEGP